MLSAIVVWLGLVSVSSAAYCTVDDYFAGTGFFDRFNFFTQDDYTHGYVNYTDRATAAAQGLIGTGSNGVYMGADHTNVASGRGRNSVRIESKSSYTTGLFVLDMTHMPGGACGEWPAFWTYGPNWPNSGEIDIIEGVNSQTTNAMAMHTTPGCNITSNNQMSGYNIFYNCDVNAANQPSNSGCSIGTPNTQTYGSGFNAAGGGVYVMQWNTTGVYIFIFPRNSIPADITAGKPIPAGWGAPVGIWSKPCVVGNYLANHNVVFDITFCGDWAGGVWSSDSTCQNKASSCNAYVQNNPSAFANSYWQIKSFKIYSDDNSGKSTCSGWKKNKRDELTESASEPEVESSPPDNETTGDVNAQLVTEQLEAGVPAAAIHVDSIAPGQGMVIVDGPDFYSPHAELPTEEPQAAAKRNESEEPEVEPTPEGEEAPGDTEGETEPAAADESSEAATDSDEEIDKRQYSPRVGANGVVQMGQPAQPVTVTVTTTVFSGRSTSTLAARANPTTMVRTTSKAAPTSRRGPNVNLLQAAAFGGWRGNAQAQPQAQPQATTTVTTSATATRTMTLASGNTPKIKKPRAWYEDRTAEEDSTKVSEADPDLLISDQENDIAALAEAQLEHETLQERLYILPDELEELVGGNTGAHQHHHDDELDEELEWEQLFGASSKDHDHAHEHDHAHIHAHHHIRHSHSHAHAHAHSHEDQEEDSEEHYYAGHDLSDMAELTPERMLKEMQRRRAEEKKATQLRKELAEIEMRRVKEMLARKGRGSHGAGSGRGAGRGKGWW